MTHSVFIQNNWQFIELWSRRWSKDNWTDLVSNLTLYLDKNWMKFSLIETNEDRIKWIQSWMRNQTRWSNTDFNKETRINNGEEEWGMPDEVVDHIDIEIAAECAPQFTKEWLIDISARMSDRDCTRLIQIKRIYHTMASHEKVLYDLYFTDMKSLREIAKQLNLPLSAVHIMVGDLKNKIKDGMDNRDY